MAADAAIRADADTDIFDIGADLFTDIGDLVHEGDLGGQHAVGGVFGHFGAANAHDDHFVAAAGKGGVKSFQQLSGADVVGADDDAVGLHEVADGIAFF